MQSQYGHHNTTSRQDHDESTSTQRVDDSTTRQWVNVCMKSQTRCPNESMYIPPLKNTKWECFAVTTTTNGMFYYFNYFIIYTNLSFRLALNDDDDDWALRRVYQPPKRPLPHPDMPCHHDASHYPTTHQLTTETANAAAGENQEGELGQQRLETRHLEARVLFFCSHF